MEKLTLGEKIMLARRRKGWDQGELAKESGVSRATIVSIETVDNINPNIPTLKALAAALGCTVEELRGE
jgi:DNA-binding XRE family transcriptional regulator